MKGEMGKVKYLLLHPLVKTRSKISVAKEEYEVLPPQYWLYGELESSIIASSPHQHLSSIGPLHKHPLLQCSIYPTNLFPLLPLQPSLSHRELAYSSHQPQSAPSRSHEQSPLWQKSGQENSSELDEELG